MKEEALHINRKELLAAYYTLRSFKTYFYKHVKIFSDSYVGVQIMNKMEKLKVQFLTIMSKIFGFFCQK